MKLCCGIRFKLICLILCLGMNRVIGYKPDPQGHSQQTDMPRNPTQAHKTFNKSPQNKEQFSKAIHSDSSAMSQLHLDSSHHEKKLESSMTIESYIQSTAPTTAQIKQTNDRFSNFSRILRVDENNVNEYHVLKILLFALDEQKEPKTAEAKLLISFGNLLHAYDDYKEFKDQLTRQYLVNECKYDTASKMLVRMAGILDGPDSFLLHQIRRWHYASNLLIEQLYLLGDLIKKLMEIRAFCSGLIGHVAEKSDASKFLLKHALGHDKLEDMMNNISEIAVTSYWDEKDGIKSLVCAIVESDVFENITVSADQLSDAINAAYSDYGAEFAVTITHLPINADQIVFSNVVHEMDNRKINDDFLEISCQTKLDKFEVIVFRCTECEHQNDNKKVQSHLYEEDQNVVAQLFQSAYKVQTSSYDENRSAGLFDALETALNATFSLFHEAPPLGECLGHFVSHANRTDTAASAKWLGHRQFLQFAFSAKKWQNPEEMLMITSVC